MLFTSAATFRHNLSDWKSWLVDVGVEVGFVDVSVGVFVDMGVSVSVALGVTVAGSEVLVGVKVGGTATGGRVASKAISRRIARTTIPIGMAYLRRPGN